MTKTEMIWDSIGNDRRGPARSYAKCSRARGIHASTCKVFWLISITFLPVAAGKNLIKCYSIYILKMGKIYIKTGKKINNFKMIS